MTNQKPSTDRKLELSPAQVGGSALAAVSAAFFASWAGTAGTIIGAALASVIATAGTATYTWWLRRTSDAVRRTASQVRVTGLGSAVVVPSLARTRSSGGYGESAPSGGPSWDPGEDPDEEPEKDPAEEPSRWSFLSGRPWGKVALASVAVMLAALGSITVVEAVTGKPLSSYLRGDTGTGTSVGHLVGNDTSTPTPSPTKDPTPTPTPTPGEDSTPSPDEQGTPTPLPTPEVTPTPTPTVPTPTPTETPQGGQTAGDGATPAP